AAQHRPAQKDRPGHREEIGNQPPVSGLLTPRLGHGRSRNRSEPKRPPSPQPSPPGEGETCRAMWRVWATVFPRGQESGGGCRKNGAPRRSPGAAQAESRISKTETNSNAKITKFEVGNGNRTGPRLGGSKRLFQGQFRRRGPARQRDKIKRRGMGPGDRDWRRSDCVDSGANGPCFRGC